MDQIWRYTCPLVDAPLVSISFLDNYEQPTFVPFHLHT